MEDEFVLVTQEDLDVSPSQDELDLSLGDVHAEAEPPQQSEPEQPAASEGVESAVLPPAQATCPPEVSGCPIEGRFTLRNLCKLTGGPGLGGCCFSRLLAPISTLFKCPHLWQVARTGRAVLSARTVPW